MKANPLRKFWICLYCIYVTFIITVATLYDVYRGKYKREVGNRRLIWWSGHLLKATRLTYKVINPNKLELKPGHRYIIMSNHNSYYDIPLMCLTFNGSVRMLTKKELFRVPIWGRGLKAGEFIAIDRHNRQQAIKDLEIAKRKMEDGITLWAAPEGSRSRTAKLLPFKKGAFILSIQTGATIIPVGIRGSEKALPPSTWTFFMDQQVDIHIGQPMDVSQYEIEDRDTILREVEKQIRTLSGKD